MSIKHYLSAAAALAMFAACSDYDPGMSDDVIDLTDAEIETIEEYNANFIARYGTPAEGHTWGFGAKGSEDEMETRMVNSDNNSNQWGVSDGFAYITDIPGWPHVNDGISPWSGMYQAENGNTYSLKTAGELTDQDHPVGDVTEEEIVYVSEWFRSHRLSDGGECPYTDFFVQDISADVDIMAYPTWRVNGNDSSAVYTGMDSRTNYPYIYDENGNPTGNYRTSAEFKLDRLVITDNPSLKVLPTESNTPQGWDHTLNFNDGSANYQPFKDGATNSGRTLTHVRSDGYPVDFACHNSDDSKYYNHWALVHLRFIGSSGKLYDGYYLGFDYEFNNTNDLARKERDYHYNNWIIKISPSHRTDDHTWYRIMCEDLGATDDYDFNDLVYDVYFTGTSGHYTAHIVVQAAGGTLPIYVATYTENQAREAHKILQNGNAQMLPNNLYQPVNVAAGVSASPSEISFEMKDEWGNWLTGSQGTDPDYIPILVTSKDGHRYEASHKNTFILLHVSENVAPQKICIPGNTVRWMKERKQIETSYTNFDKWVGQPNEYDFGRPNDWTKVGVNVNSGNLY